MLHTLKEGQGIEIGGVPLVVVRARKGAVSIMQGHGGGMDGEDILLPETLAELHVRARATARRLDVGAESVDD